jgi:hypothetical protein
MTHHANDSPVRNDRPRPLLISPLATVIIISTAWHFGTRQYQPRPYVQHCGCQPLEPTFTCGRLTDAPEPGAGAPQRCDAAARGACARAPSTDVSAALLPAGATHAPRRARAWEQQWRQRNGTRAQSPAGLGGCGGCGARRLSGDEDSKRDLDDRDTTTVIFFSCHQQRRYLHRFERVLLLAGRRAGRRLRGLYFLGIFIACGCGNGLSPDRPAPSAACVSRAGWASRTVADVWAACG